MDGIYFNVLQLNDRRETVLLRLLSELMETDYAWSNAVRVSYIHVLARGNMSDFTDDEDRQLVQLALLFLRSRRQILWDTLAQQMKGSKKPKEALRQRLKTLKRTHGRDLANFPAWFFRKKFATEAKRRRANAHRKTAIHKSDKLVLTRESQYIPQGCARCEAEVALRLNDIPSIKTPMDHKDSLMLTMATCFPESVKAKPPASLLLLASVAAFEPLESHKKRIN